MDRSQAFWLGFIIAGLIGWLASVILQSFASITKAKNRIFSVPNPDLKSISGSRYKSIGTNPDHSPVEVLKQGCTTIVQQLFLILIIVVILGWIIWLNIDIGPPRPGRVQDFFVGALVFAPVTAILLQMIYKNWTAIRNLHNRMINPPSPSLNKANSSSNYYFTAKPTVSAYHAVVTGIVEIFGRLVWEIILSFALFLVLRAISSYLAT